MNWNFLKDNELWGRLRYLIHRFGADHCSEHAAALTYMSLFALVPLLTLLFTMASAIPASQGMEERIQDLLFTHLMPETGSEIEEYLQDFSRQARNLTGPGIVFLLVTAVLMLRNIENAFNTIWRAPKNRSAVSSFLLYWAMLSLAPLTIGLALALGTYLSSLSRYFTDLDILGAGSLLLSFVPLLLSAAGFTLLYVAIPNCQVPFKHTVIGGLAAALAFNAARSLFTDLMVGSNYTFIYGAFAAVPLFLLWIYVSWNIVLTGGILVHSLSAYESSEQAARPTVMKALDVLYLFWQRQQSGLALREVDMINDSHEVLVGLDSVTWGQLRDLFLREKLIAQNDRGQYFLSRDLHGISFWQLKEWVANELPLSPEDIQAHLPWQEKAYGLLREQRQQQRELLDINLAELFGC
jgi:membrane protein